MNAHQLFGSKMLVGIRRLDDYDDADDETILLRLVFSFVS